MAVVIVTQFFILQVQFVGHETWVWHEGGLDHLPANYSTGMMMMMKIMMVNEDDIEDDHNCSLQDDPQSHTSGGFWPDDE